MSVHLQVLCFLSFYNVTLNEHTIAYLVEFSSVAQLYPALCDPMDCSTPGLPVHHKLPELAQTHVHRVSDAVQPSHPLYSPQLMSFTSILGF